MNGSRIGAYDGGNVEHWLAPAMNEHSPAPVPWTAESLFNYLRNGFDARHGAELVGRGVAHGREPPVLDELAVAIGPEVGLGVADVDDEEHA